jgi:CubicO group peptidase (beta-lactamase class C family)
MKQRMLAVIVVGLLFGQFASAVRAEVASANFDAARLKSLPSAMQRFVDEHEISGAVVVVGNAEGVASIDAIGQRELASGDAMRQDSLFRIASMTKPVTAIAVAMLVEEGKLSFDDPVEKHLAEFRGQRLIVERDGERRVTVPASRPITIRELLTHTSGMPGGPPPGLAELYRRRDRTLNEAVLAFSQLPLEFEPGSRWSYSNTGIDTAGRVVEAVSGQSFEEFLSTRLFQPLGMQDTVFYPSDEQRGRLATMYRREGDQLLPAEESLIEVPRDAKYPLPAGGLCSTGSDLAKLYQAMLRLGEGNGQRFLKPDSVAELTRLQTGALETGFVPGMGFGLGWAHVREPQGVTASLSPGSYGHGGAFGTQAWIDPQRGWFAILLIQRVGLPNADASPMRSVLQETVAAAIER